MLQLKDPAISSVAKGGGTRIFGGHEKFIRVWDQTKKVKTKKNRSSVQKLSTNSGYRLEILAIFHEFLNEDQRNKQK